jgi:hypothetical protein
MLLNSLERDPRILTQTLRPRCIRTFESMTFHLSSGWEPVAIERGIHAGIYHQIEVRAVTVWQCRDVPTRVC